jgi:hypothetical protein
MVSLGVGDIGGTARGFSDPFGLGRNAEWSGHLSLEARDSNVPAPFLFCMRDGPGICATRAVGPVPQQAPSPAENVA